METVLVRPLDRPFVGRVLDQVSVRGPDPLRSLLHRRARRYFGAWRDDYFLPDGRIALVAVPKAANTSLKYQLLEAQSGPDAAQVLARARRGSDAQAIHDAMRESSFRCAPARLTAADVAIILATVRHPIDRLVSFFKDKVAGDGWPPRKRGEVARLWGIERGMTFDRVAGIVADTPDEESEVHFRAQADLIGAHVIGDARLVAIRTERFADDLAAVAPRLGLRTDRVERRNATSRDAFAVPEATRRRLRERYARDFELFYPDAT